MIASRLLTFVIGLVSPGAAYANQNASNLRSTHHRLLHHGAVYHRAPMRIASAFVPPVVFWPPPSVLMHEKYVIEGLSRDPNACVVYGCIGNN
jgi:hypothetical protein